MPCHARRRPVILLLTLSFILPPSSFILPSPAQNTPTKISSSSPTSPTSPPATEEPRLGANHLASSKSPYLLQHADNPVHWFPWNDEAFALAKSENKPVFLSIGYSTCHWCHVMEHESFEDKETADFLNKYFISVKVDREERPDVDRIYMNYQQAVHGSGGWPLSVWLTADRVPFFSGTYFPKEAKPGQTSFIALLTRIQETWNLHAEEMTSDSARILEGLKKYLTQSPSETPDPNQQSKTPPPTPAPDSTLLRKAFEALAASFDPQNGGFGARPKFPQPVFLNFLLDYRATLDPENETAVRSLKFVETTLRKMADGGIHDHLGGGFHRYAVEETWHVPHFEKMLYDQAQLASAYLDAFHITRDPLFASVARDIFTYVETTLSHPGGAFYSAEDADSAIPASHLAIPHPSLSSSPPSDPTQDEEVERAVPGEPSEKSEIENQQSPTSNQQSKTSPIAPSTPEKNSESSVNPVQNNPSSHRKAEGAFYLWTTAEVTKALGDTNAPVFIAAYGLAGSGNAPPGSDSFGEFKNKNILYRKKSTTDLAKAFAKTEPEIDAILAECRATLLELRAQRPRPHLDDKILTAWNGLMISAYAKAHLVLQSSSPSSSIDSPPTTAASTDSQSSPPSPSDPTQKNSVNSVNSVQKDPSPSTFFLSRAILAATFLRENLYDPETKTLLRSYRDGPSPIHATADDYAFYIQALLDLYDASLDTQWLAFATELHEQQLALLEDTENGGFFDSPATQSDLILRLKNSHDGARPSANSVSALNLIRLGALIKSDQYDTALDKLINFFAADLQRNPVGQTVLLTAIARRLQTPTQVVIAGPPDHPGTAAILRLVRARHISNKVTVLLDGGPHSAFFASKNDLYAAFKPIDGQPTLYLCKNYTCQKPTNDPKEIALQLDSL